MLVKAPMRLDMDYPSSYCLPLAPICYSACRRCNS